MADAELKLPQDTLKVISLPEVPKMYANGFQIVMSNSDVSILLIQNNVPVAVVNVSYTIAKTLSEKVGELIGKLEARSKQPIMTTDDINKYLQEEQSGPRLS
jgi:hypothetical protein